MAVKPFTDKLYHFRALVDKVHDGDTFHVKLDLGFYPIWLEAWVRLGLGVDTPEMTTRVDGKIVPNPDGESATQGLMSYLGFTPTPTRTRGYFGQPGDYLLQPGSPEPELIVRTVLNDEFEKYGRVLGSPVWVRSYGEAATTVNDFMRANYQKPL